MRSWSYARLGVVAAVAVLFTAGLVAPASASATGLARSGGVPATPALIVPLHQGVNSDSHLSAAQKTIVGVDIRWLHGRLNIILPRILWTGPVLRTDGLFDSETTTAVKFFQTWADHSRALLHESALFPSVNGVVGTTGADVIAIVGAYFQLHPAVAYVNPTTAGQLAGYLLSSASLGALMKSGFTNPSDLSWKLADTASSDTDGPLASTGCATSAPAATVWAQAQYAATSSQGSFGSAISGAIHFSTAAEASAFVDVWRSSTYASCLKGSTTSEFESDLGGTLSGAATISSLPAAASGVAYRWSGVIGNSTGSCTYFDDYYWAALGDTVITADIETCHVPWDAAIEQVIVTGQANRLVRH